MSSLEDHQVDRTEVYRRISKGLELTVTNRANVVVVRAGVFRDFGVAKSSAVGSLEGVPRPETAALFTSNFSQVTIPAGPHPFPFRTRPLSLPGPMIVDKAKVGRCLGFFY